MVRGVKIGVEMKLYLIVIVAFFGLAKAEDEDLQTEFYLPYSVTEDVDFSLSRPGGFGCFQW